MINVIRYFILFFGFFMLMSCQNQTNPAPSEAGAIRLYDPRFELKKEEAIELNDKGLEAAENGQLKEANGLLLAALKIEPNSPVILNNLGVVAMNMGQVQDAIDYYRESFGASKYKYMQPASNLAATYLNVGYFEDAIDISLFVLEREPAEEVEVIAHLTLVLAYSASKKCSDAKVHFSLMKKKAGRAARWKGRLENAAKAIRQCEEPSA